MKSHMLHSSSIILLTLLLIALPCRAQENDEVRFAPPLKLIWQKQVEARTITGNQISLFAEPKFDERRVYFASTNGVLYCVFKGSWAESWTFNTAAPISLNFTLNGEILCLSDGNNVYGLDSRTGIPLWIHSAPSTVTAGLVTSNEVITAGMVTHEEAVYYADILGSVRSLSVKTGEQLWEYKPTIEEGDENSANVQSGLYVDDQFLIFGDESGRLTTLRSRTGDRIWTFKAEGAIQSGILRQGQRLFFGSDDNYVYCVDVGSGKLNWRQRTAGDVRGIPVADDEYVYITSRDRSLRVINIYNGYPARVGPIDLPANFDFKPLLVDNLVYMPHAASIAPRITEGTFRMLTPYANPNGDVSTSLVYDEAEKFLYFGTRLGRFVVLAPDALKLDEFIVSPDVAADIDLPTEDPTQEPDRPRRNRRNQEQEESPAEQPKNDQAATEKSEEEKPENSNPPPQTEEGKNEVSAPATDAVPPEKPGETPGVEIKPEKNEPADVLPLSARLQQGRETLRAGDLQRAASQFTEALHADARKWYTINLGLYCQPDSITALINSLQNEDVLVFSRFRDEQTCYFICIGLYETREAAEFAIADMDLSARFEADINALRLDSFFPEIE